MKTAILAFSKSGSLLANKIARLEKVEIFSKYDNKMVKMAGFSHIWEEYDRILFIGASGIAVRYISPFVRRKDRDPAVLVMDDQGKFLISLLSGHLGGANEWARQLGKKIGARPVITTASDSRNFQSLDLFAQENNYYIENLASLTPIAGAMVDGEEVAFYSEGGPRINYPRLRVVGSLEEARESQYSILVTEKILQVGSNPSAVLRPRSLHLGIGARKGAKIEDLLDLLKMSFQDLDLSIYSIKDMSSIDIKKEEKALIALSQHLNIPFYTFSVDQLKPFEDQCQGSEFVKKTVGVGSVSCTSALKQGSQLILDKRAHRGFTLSVSKE